MCKVMEDMRNQSLKEGLEEGLKKGLKKGMKKGMKKGLKKGEKKRMKATALRMLEAGKYALEEIADISGLSLDEVKSLQTGQSA